MRPVRGWMTLLLVVALVGVTGVSAWNHHQQLTTAETTTGTVVTSDVDSYSRGIPLTDAAKHYDVTLNYTYTVDGQTYAGHQATPGWFDSGSNRRPAQAIVNRFADGNEVTVYYNPQNPESAYLVRQYSFFPAYPALILALFLLADLLTPSSRLINHVFDRLQIGDRRGSSRTPSPDDWSHSGDDRIRSTDEWNDPDSLDLSDDQPADDADNSRFESDERSPLPTVRGTAAWGVWVAAGVLSLALLGHYLTTVELPPHPLAYLSAIGIVAAGVVVTGRRVLL